MKEILIALTDLDFIHIRNKTLEKRTDNRESEAWAHRSEKGVSEDS